MRKTRCIYKLKKAAVGLNIKMSRSGSFYELEYEHLPILLSVSNEDDTFVLISHVYDTQDCLDEQQLKIALDVVDGYHENYSGDWNDGVPYFASPEYYIGHGVDVTPEWFEKQLKEFWEAFTFLQANTHLLGDASIMNSIGLSKASSNVMDEQALNSMIAKRYICDNSMIAITANDISRIKKESDFIDGCEEVSSETGVKETLIAMSDKLRAAHPDAKLNRFAIKFITKATKELNLDMFNAINEFLDTLQDDFDVIWGLSTAEDVESDVLVCMVCGYNK